jgi:plasmid stabilization system protein ParE
MPRILRSLQSREDYRSIYNYVSNDSPQNAEMLIRLFDQKLELLARHNTMGRVDAARAI